MYESYGRRQFDGHPEQMRQDASAAKTSELTTACQTRENINEVFLPYSDGHYTRSKVAETNDHEGWLITGGAQVDFIKLEFDDSSHLLQSCTYTFNSEKDFYESGLLDSFEP